MYAVALNPKQVLCYPCQGIKHDLNTGELTQDSLGNVTNVFVPGSVVKAATISLRLGNGVLSGNQTLNTDQPIVFHIQLQFYSWYKLAYGSFLLQLWKPWSIHLMLTWFKTALGIMGQDLSTKYVCWNQQFGNSYGKLRPTFALNMVLEPQQALTFQMSQLVLYQKSIISLITLPMHFGQFDNYTPMQLAQYVGTIANNGVRIAPHIVEGIYGNNEQGRLRGLNPNC